MKLHSKSKWTHAQKILRYKKWNEVKKFRKRKGRGIFSPWLKTLLQEILTDLFMHYFSPKANRTPELQSVDEWLQHINMGKYSELFRDARIDDINKVAELKEKQWREMGISLIGHRNKMQKSINAMKSQHYNGGMDAD